MDARVWFEKCLILNPLQNSTETEKENRAVIGRRIALCSLQLGDLEQAKKDMALPLTLSNKHSASNLFLQFLISLQEGNNEEGIFISFIIIILFFFVPFVSFVVPFCSFVLFIFIFIFLCLCLGMLLFAFARFACFCVFRIATS